MKLKAIGQCLGVALLACLPVAAQTNYDFTTIDYPNDTFTQLLGINNQGVIAGYHGADVNKGFTYVLKTKTFNNENYPNSAMTQVIGINNSPAKTVGFFVDNAGRTWGFEARGGVFMKVNFPGGPFNQLLGQNNFGQAAGYYSTKADGTGPDHAYIYDENGGVFEVLTIPGSTSAQATGINDASSACGFFIDSTGANHGWLLIQGTLRQLDFPSSTNTQALGLNNKGVVVGVYQDASTMIHGFTYDVTAKTWQSIDDPNGVGTTIVNGINDNGMLVGFYGNSPINSGFLAVPAP